MWGGCRSRARLGPGLNKVFWAGVCRFGWPEDLSKFLGPLASRGRPRLARGPISRDADEHCHWPEVSQVSPGGLQGEKHCLWPVGDVPDWPEDLSKFLGPLASQTTEIKGFLGGAYEGVCATP